MKLTALIYNYAQHYRLPIYKELEKNMSIHYYFGNPDQTIKSFDYKELKGFQKELKNIKILGPIYWQSGVIRLAFKNYDNYIVLGEYFCLSYWIFLLILTLRKKNIIIWTHGWYGNEGFMKTIVKKIFFSFSNYILLYGNYAKKLMISEGFSATKLKVVYNSLDFYLQKELYLRQKSENLFSKIFNNKFFNIIFIGRVQKSKKLYMVFEALNNLKQKGIYFNFTIVGDGSEINFLKNYAKQLNIEKSIWFYGESYNEDITSKLIYNSDLCVSPGNVGLTAINSLSFGTPVITHNNFQNQGPEFESIIPYKTGLFFKENDVLSMSDAIEVWMKIDVNRADIRGYCRKVIDEKYNPLFQVGVIKEVLR